MAPEAGPPSVLPRVMLYFMAPAESRAKIQVLPPHLLTSIKNTNIMPHRDSPSLLGLNNVYYITLG